MNATQKSAEALADDIAYMRVKQFCKRFSLSKSMTHGLIDQGELKSVRIGRAVLIPVDSVAEFEARLNSSAQ